jgi:beta-lactamase class A
MFKRIFFFLLVVNSLLFMSSTQFDASRLQAEFAQASSFFMPVNLEPVSALDADFPMEEAAPLAALRDFANESLQDQLKARILANPVWAKLYRTKKLSIGLVDMQEETQPRFATLNGRHMMYAASLPKIAVLAAAQDAIERGELEETEQIRRDMRLMIAKSNNAATTRMIDLVGFEHIERTMTSPELKLYDPEFGGGLWVGKRYAAGGRRYPDPIKGISHAATAEQVCRYFYLLANGRLISEEASREMMSYLVDPELHHKFVNTLDRIAPNATVYRKSGSWSVFHADVAMVQGPERNYIMTALVEDPKGEQICRELAEVLDELVVLRS